MNVPSTRFWFGFFSGIFTTVILAVVVIGIAGIVHHASPPVAHHVPPPHDDGTFALIRIHANRPIFLFDEEQKNVNEEEYRRKVSTYIALMRSPDIINRTLENHDVAQIPDIRHQKNAPGFLLRNLKIERLRDSEIIRVSMHHVPHNEAATIVNALVDTFFDYQAVQSQNNDQRLLTQLSAEFQRQNRSAEFLQNSIREKTVAAARNSGSPRQNTEELQIAYEQAETKLKILTAKETSIAAQLVSEIAQKGESTEEWERKLNEVQTEIQNQMKTVSECRAAYLTTASNRSVNVVDISFDKDQLDRTKRVMDALSDRMVKRQAERHAPDEIQVLYKAKTDANTVFLVQP